MSEKYGIINNYPKDGLCSICLVNEDENGEIEINLKRIIHHTYDEGDSYDEIYMGTWERGTLAVEVYNALLSQAMYSRDETTKRPKRYIEYSYHPGKNPDKEPVRLTEEQLRQKHWFFVFTNLSGNEIVALYESLHDSMCYGKEYVSYITDVPCHRIKYEIKRRIKNKNKIENITKNYTITVVDTPEDILRLEAKKYVTIYHVKPRVCKYCSKAFTGSDKKKTCSASCRVELCKRRKKLQESAENGKC